MKGFPNILVLGIIAAVVLIGAGIGGYWVFVKKSIMPTAGNQTRKIFIAQEECQQKTGKVCSEIMCDYVPPDKTFEEVCGKDFKKGWVATSQMVPQNASSTIGISTWKTYRNEKYGFELRYPSDTSIIEGGTNLSDDVILGESLPSGTQFPTIGEVVLQKGSDYLLFIDIFGNRESPPPADFKWSDFKNYPSPVSEDYEWTLRPCGQQGFNDIVSQEEITFKGYKTLKVESVAVYEEKKSMYTFYCINFPPSPIIISFGDQFKSQANQILSTFKFVEPTKKIVLSTKKVYFFENAQGEINLYSHDFDVETTVDLSSEPLKPGESGIYCGTAQSAGKKVYEGNFKLSFQGRDSDIGSKMFAEGTFHNGELFVLKLNPQANEDFIAFGQYGSCNGDYLEFYRFDLVAKKIVPIFFRTKNDSEMGVYVGLGRTGDIKSVVEILPSREFITRGYNNATGYEASKWKFDASQKTFVEVASCVKNTDTKQCLIDGREMWPRQIF